MKLRALLFLTAAFALVTAPAMATIRDYSWQADARVCTISQPCSAPGVGGLLNPAGTWEGGYTIVRIDDNGGGASPVLVKMIVHNATRRVYNTSATTGVPGSTATVTTDIRTSAGPGTVGTRVGNSVNWGNVAVTAVGGGGQFCIETAPGGCAAAGMATGVWGSFIPPKSPINSDPWTVAPDFSTFSSSTLYRYFDLNPILGVNIYGEMDNQAGAVTAQGVPVLAPLGALALGSSLVLMGARSLRRKQA